MNTVLLLVTLSLVLDVKANQSLDQMKRYNDFGWGLVASTICTSILGVVIFAAAVVKWCLLP